MNRVHIRTVELSTEENNYQASGKFSNRNKVYYEENLLEINWSLLVLSIQERY